MIKSGDPVKRWRSVTEIKVDSQRQYKIMEADKKEKAVETKKIKKEN